MSRSVLSGYRPELSDTDLEAWTESADGSVLSRSARFVVPDGPAGLTPRQEPPTFSVVVPVYQAASTVRAAVESVLAQTLAPHEIIVCDDGSTDDLVGALSPIADQITLLHAEHKGVAAARNLGLFHATGEFVVVCDADDVQLPRMLEALGELAQVRPDLDILARNCYMERDGQVVRTSRTAEHPRFPTKDQRGGILARNFLPGASALRRQRLVDLGGFDESLLCAEDYDAWVRLIFAGCRAGLVLEPLAIYRIRDGSLSTKEVWHLQGLVEIYGKILQSSEATGAERLVANDRLTACRRLLVVAHAKAALRHGSRDARRQCLGVVFGEGQRLGTRMKAAAAVVAPKRMGSRI